MNNLQIFKNEEFGEVRAIEINNEPWFVGRDVAEALGYGDGNNKSKALANALFDHVDKEDKQLLSYEDFKRYQNGDLKNISHFGAYIINESGLYNLIISSRLPTAKRGEFPTKRQIDAYLHKRKGFTRKLMQGIEPWKDGRSLRYYAGDVAERIVECWL